MAAIVVVPHDLLGDALLPEAQSLVNDHHDVEKGEYGTFASKEEKVVLDSWKDTADEKDAVSLPELECDHGASSRVGDHRFSLPDLQLPQILLNTQNLLKGDFAALFAVQWLGQLTGLLGNLPLLSYFSSKRETGAHIVLLQLAIAGALPLRFLLSLRPPLGWLLDLISTC